MQNTVTVQTLMFAAAFLCFMGESKGRLFCCDFSKSESGSTRKIVGRGDHTFCKMSS